MTEYCGCEARADKPCGCEYWEDCECPAVAQKNPVQIRVYHSYYGCESGCCGHVIEFDDERVDFEFGGPPTDDPEGKRAWARALVEPYLRERHPECVDSIDWNEMDIDGVCY